MSCNNLKRKRTEILPLSVKLRALDYLKSGASVNNVANELNVTENTVKNWLKSENKLLKWNEDHNGDISEQQKRIRKVENSLVDKATWIWYREKRAAGVPIQGTFIQRQAKQFNSMLNGNENFEASNGWLQKWRKRHNVRISGANNNKMPVKKDPEFLKQEFKHYIEQGFDLDQIFYCVEMIFNFKMLPVTESKDNFSSSQDSKHKKERISLMICSNVSGTLKLPVVFVGKCAKPRAIKNLSSLPVWYRSEKSAWLGSKIFEEWFETEFATKVTDFLYDRELNNKAVLFVDSCSTNLYPLPDHNFTVRFFSPNSTHQFFDPDYLQNLRMFYRQMWMKHIIDVSKKGETLSQILKNVFTKIVIFWVADAWKRVSSEMIRKSWQTVNKMVPIGNFERIDFPADDVDSKDLIKLIDINEDVLLNQFHEVLRQDPQYKNIDINQIKNWYNLSKGFTPDDCMSDKEIVEFVKSQDTHTKDPLNLVKVDKDVIPAPKPKITTFSARRALYTLITYCEENPTSDDILESLYSLKTNLEAKQLQSIGLKQNCI